jgi:hypothetical protein
LAKKKNKLIKMAAITNLNPTSNVTRDSPK